MHDSDNFSKHDWAHMHDAILHATGKNFTQEELVETYNNLPLGLQTEAYEWGMSDTLFRDKLITYFENKSK